MLVVVRQFELKEPNKARRSYYECLCDCGNTVIYRADRLLERRYVSCGCVRKKKENPYFKHNESKTKLYKVWAAMLQRCENPKCRNYKNYGGRGISVSKEWHDFETFKSDMGERPLNTSLDRINNNGNYCKENCRWATSEQQSANRRVTLFFNYKGEVLTRTQIIKKENISYEIARRRYPNSVSIKQLQNVV